MEENLDEKTQRRFVQAELIKRTGIVVIAFGIMFVIVLQAVLFNKQANTVEEIRATQTAGSPTLIAVKNVLEDVNKVTKTIEDCLLSGGVCYTERIERNRAVTRFVVTSALACQQDMPNANAQELLDCVEAKKQPPLPPVEDSTNEGE